MMTFFLLFQRTGLILYFHDIIFVDTWWGHPSRWQWATVAVTIFCLFWIILRSSRPLPLPSLLLPAIIPFFLGLAFTFLQQSLAHRLYGELTPGLISWHYHFQVPLDLAIMSLCTAHLGLAGSIIAASSALVLHFLPPGMRPARFSL